MFEQAKLQGTQMGPNGPPNAKGTAQIAPEIANYRKPGVFWSFWPFWPKRPFLSFWPAISETGWTRRKKVPLVVLFRSTSPGYVRFWPRPLPREAKQKNFYWRGF